MRRFCAALPGLIYGGGFHHPGFRLAASPRATPCRASSPESRLRREILNTKSEILIKS